MAVGDTVASWFASILSTDATEAGYIVGMIVTSALFAIGLIFSSRSRTGGMSVMAGMALFGAIVSWFMGWWPPATILVFGLFFAFTAVFGFKGAPVSD